MTVAALRARWGLASAATTIPLVTDGVFVAALCLLGMIGFRSTYGGVGYLVAGMLGVVLGVAISEVAVRLKMPIVIEVVVTLAAFLILGGIIAARTSTIGGLVPTASTVSDLLRAAVNGWKELLTTNPPVGNSSNLLAIPYLVGLVGGAAAWSISRRTRTSLLPLVAPAGIVAIGILFGTERPAALFLQGGLFTALAVIWAHLRSSRRLRLQIAGGRRRSRILAVIAIAGVSAAVAPTVGPRLPLAGAHQRVVLDRYVVPPFDANSYPSPLSDFRRYTPSVSDSLAGTLLYRVSGSNSVAGAGDLLRIATMDAYDGLAWGFGSAAPGGSGDVFQRYGSAIPAGVSGPRAKLTVQVERSIDAVDPDAQWLPDAGAITSVEFRGPNSTSLSNQFRYDLATSTAVDPVIAEPGDSYTMTVVPVSRYTPAQLQAAPAGSDPVDVAVVGALKAASGSWTANSTGAWDKVMAIAAKLKLGFYSDGSQEPGEPSDSPAGNSAGRLSDFVTGDALVGTQIVGDDEQYAAAMALMADYVGVPSRVVLGAQIEPGGLIRGRDVQAWVEVQLGGLGWVAVPNTDYERHNPPSTVIPQVKQSAESQNAVAPPTASDLHPPPAGALPSSSAASTTGLNHKKKLRRPGFRLPGYVVTAVEVVAPPFVVLAAFSSTTVALKTRRRRRRMTVGSPTARMAAAWRELLDRARDLGHPFPEISTRREQAGALPFPEAGLLAQAADRAVFAPGDPSEDEVSALWAGTSEVAAKLAAGRGRFARWWAAVNPATLVTKSAIPHGIRR